LSFKNSENAGFDGLLILVVHLKRIAFDILLI